MCGYGTISIITYVIERGLIAAAGEKMQVVIESPDGKIIAIAHCEGTKVKSVSFENVPSFVYSEILLMDLKAKVCRLILHTVEPFTQLSMQVNLSKRVSFSIVNSRYTWEIIGETLFGPYRAVIPRVTGNAFITGMHQSIVDPTDPLYDGFLIG